MTLNVKPCETAVIRQIVKFTDATARFYQPANNKGELAMQLNKNTHMQAAGVSLAAFVISLAAILAISGNANAREIKTLEANPIKLDMVTKVERAAVAARGAVARPATPVYSGSGSWDRDR